MMTTTTWRMTMMIGRVVALLTLMLALAFGAAAGQSAAVDRSAEIERADALALHGRQLAKFRGSYAEASRYLRAAAELRGSDRAAVEELVEAGHLSYYAGRTLTAMNTLASAAKVAIEVGDATTAADAYLDAAWIAHRARKPDVALEYLARGETLVRSAAVADEDRATFLARIEELRQ